MKLHSKKTKWSKVSALLVVSTALIVGLGAALAYGAFSTTPPTSLVATDTQVGNQVLLTWNGGPGDYEYSYKLASAGDGSYVASTTVVGTTTVTVTNPALLNGTQYVFRVGNGTNVTVSAPIAPSDHTAPVAALVVFPAANPAGWYSAVPTYTITAVDPSGISKYEAQIDGTGSPTVVANGGPVGVGSGSPVLIAGTHTLYYRATDAAASLNVGAWASQTFKIDLTKPTVVLTHTEAAASSGWYTTVPTMTLTPADTGGSGIASTSYQWNALTPTVVATDAAQVFLAPQGSNVLTYSSLDVAGNQSDIASTTVKVDSVKPSVPGTPTAVAALGGTIKVTFPAATDTVPGSGVSTYTVQSSLDTSFSAPVLEGTITTTTLTTGSYPEGTMLYFRVKAFDVASNESTWSVTSAVVTADVNAPVITVLPVSSSAWTTPSINATISIVSTNTGLAFVNYQVTKTGTTTPSVNTTLTAVDTTQVVVAIPEGAYTLTVTAKDLAGNVATPVTKVYTTDSHAPVTVIDHTVPAAADGAGGTWASFPTVTLKATDVAYGAVIDIKYKWDNGTTVTVAASSTVDVPAPSVAGTRTLTYWAQDAAGNIEAVHTQSYFIDLLQPVVTMNLTGTPNGAGWLSSQATMTITATTSPAGKPIANIFYKYDSASTWTTYTVGATGFPVIEGSHTLTAYAVDASSTAGLAKTVSYKLDLTKPVIDPTTVVVHSATATVAIGVTEAGSGVASGVMTRPGESATVTTSTAGLNGKFIMPWAVGDNLVLVTATDVAGNSSVAGGTYVHVSYLPTYAITITTPTNGTITGPTSADYGTNAVYTITPAAGYHVVGVTDNGVAQGALASYTVFNVQGTHTIAATFAADVAANWTLTGTAGSNGTLSLLGTQTFAANTPVTVVVSANAGYHVADVLVDGTSVGAVSSKTLVFASGSHTISATFAANPASTFTITGSAGAHGAIIGATDVLAGSDLTVGIQADAGYHIANVSVDGVSKGVVSSFTFLNVTADHTISATFAVNTATTFTITGSAGTGGSLSISGATVVEGGSNLTVGVTPDTGYEIVSVTVDGVAKPLGAVTFTNIAANHTVSATFALKKIATKLTINANPITRRLGLSAHFFGVIAPNMPDRTPIRLMVRKSGQLRWTNVVPYVRTFGGYHWSFYYHPNTRGTYYFKVYFAGNAQYLGTTSRTITLHWK